MPDEYLLPNALLFLQNLPDGTTKEDLQEVFNQYVMQIRGSNGLHSTNATYVRYPNLLEVRLIPAKKDIAFVEYADEESATVAKEALHNFKIDGETKMKVSFRRTSGRTNRILKRCPFLLGVVCQEVEGYHLLYNSKWLKNACLVLKAARKVDTELLRCRPCDDDCSLILQAFGRFRQYIARLELVYLTHQPQDEELDEGYRLDFRFRERERVSRTAAGQTRHHGLIEFLVRLSSLKRKRATDQRGRGSSDHRFQGSFRTTKAHCPLLHIAHSDPIIQF